MEDGRIKKDNRTSRWSASIPADLRPRMDATSAIKTVTVALFSSATSEAAAAEHEINKIKQNIRMYHQ